MAELFFQHDAVSYLYDTQVLKLFRLEGEQSIEIDNPETMRNVRFHSVEISREQALKIAGGCHA